MSYNPHEQPPQNPPAFNQHNATADSADELTASFSAAAREVRKVVVGQERALERLLACLLAGGHALLEGVPGVGKTVMLQALAKSVGGSFSRIQFTADLMPSDIVGTRIYRASSEEFTVEPGPVFANFVLADEVNRAPAKVQSGLLEVMSEGQVTLGGETLKLPQPFLVLATQNPIDSEGTYPLPEAQRDRFMMRIVIGYPTAAEEWEIMHRADQRIIPEAMMTPEGVAELQRRTQQITFDPAAAKYALDLVMATRDPVAYGVGDLADKLAYGASPRATLSLMRASRGIALLRGRSYVHCQDIYDIAYDVLNHRLVLSYKALSEGVDADAILQELLGTVKATQQHGGALHQNQPPAAAPQQPAAWY